MAGDHRAGRPQAGAIGMAGGRRKGVRQRTPLQNLSQQPASRFLRYILPTTSISTLVTFSAFSLKMVTISSQDTGGSSVFQQS